MAAIDIIGQRANMTNQFTQGYDPTGSAHRIVDGVYSLSQRKGGRVHAYLLDDGDALTLIDTLYDDDGARIVRAIQQIGRQITDLKHIVITHAQTPEKILAPKIIAAEDLAHCEETGAALAAGLEAGIF